MYVQQVFDIIESKYAALSNQEDYDNSGVQIAVYGNGRNASNTTLTGILVCLDVTEAVIDEAISTAANLIVSHHPLLFRPLKHLTGETWQERCVIKAIRYGISIYSAHTSLDNAKGGVNHKIAQMIGLKDLHWLEERSENCGSGLIGSLFPAEEAECFLKRLKSTFNTECLMHNACRKKIEKVALCGGAGSFLLGEAMAQKADCFITGEMSYHHYFGHDEQSVFAGGDEQILIVELGHFQSEQFTIDLLYDILEKEFPDARIMKTTVITNPTKYLI